VLPDKIPFIDTDGTSPIDLSSYHRTAFFVGSFADDEPLAEILEAARSCPAGSVQLFISGRISKASRAIIENAPRCVTFTDFLSDDGFNRLLGKVDLVFVLTTAEHTLLCGCYEAVAAGAALVTSRTRVLEEYFGGAHHIENTSHDIRTALLMPRENVDAIRTRVLEMRPLIERDWETTSNQLRSIVEEGDANV
jgi:hypothetical protein